VASLSGAGRSSPQEEDSGAHSQHAKVKEGLKFLSWGGNDPLPQWRFMTEGNSQPAHHHDQLLVMLQSVEPSIVQVCAEDQSHLVI